MSRVKRSLPIVETAKVWDQRRGAHSSRKSTCTSWVIYQGSPRGETGPPALHEPPLHPSLSLSLALSSSWASTLQNAFPLRVAPRLSKHSKRVACLFFLPPPRPSWTVKCTLPLWTLKFDNFDRWWRGNRRFEFWGFGEYNFVYSSYFVGTLIEIRVLENTFKSRLCNRFYFLFHISVARFEK